MASRLQLSGISKVYGTLRANDGIDLAVSAGEIHAVLGENGAGKSTLMKIIYGVTKPDAGQMQFDGRTVHIRDPRHARSLGIAMVFQHFSLFETLTVAENVWLGLDKSFTLDAVRGRIRAVTQQYGLELDPQRHVHSLSVGERQRVEIVRALLTNPKLLILDEPTSVLTPQAVQKLFDTLRQLAFEGCSILYISHKLDEIRALCHSCTVLRGGKVTGRVDPRQETSASLSRLMIGAEPPTVQHASRAAGQVRLAIKNLNLPRLDQFGTALQDISFEVHAGEILGIAGVSGNGQAELLTALSGEDVRAASNCILLEGHAMGDADPKMRREKGLNFVPEERLGRGAVPSLSLAENLLLTDNRAGRISRGWIDRKAVAEQARLIIKTFDVKAGGPQAAARSLSGGNLQKFIVGREIMQSPKVLIVSQPTWGVDVGAAARIHEELARLRDAGCAILVVSEELDELFELCDRLVVMAKGRVSPAIKTVDATVEQIGQWMSGLWKPEAMEAGHVAA
jgi:general nucleoside transport system ATP-binding protein